VQATAAPAPVTLAPPAPTTGTTITRTPVTLASPTPVTGSIATVLAAPPAPTGVSVTGTPATATVVWQPVTGVASYVVTRKQNGQTGQQAKLAAGETRWLDTGVLPATAYSYKVDAFYPDGRDAFTEVAFTTPAAINPSGFTANQTGNGQVQLAWQPVRGASYYLVLGAGSAQGGVKVSGATSYLVTGAPAGAQQWLVGTIYDSGTGAVAGSGVSTPATQFSAAQLTVTAAAVSGNYLITITGLRAVWSSVDDALSRDGVGDEVYLATFIRQYDRRTGGVTMFTSKRTLTYGDVNGFGTSRVQAGTRSGTGGIQDGDPIPARSDPTERSGNPSDVGFPLKLWSGTLSNGAEALVFSPTIWEEDGTNSAYLMWNQQMNDITAQLYQRPEIQDQLSRGTFEPIMFGTSAQPGISDLAWTQAMITAGAGLAGPTMGLSFAYQVGERLFSGATDRPIGLIPSGIADVSMVLPNKMVVLTREIIETALAPTGTVPTPIGLPYWPRMPKPGVMMIPFRDGPHNSLAGMDRPAYYEMYLKVERIP